MKATLMNTAPLLAHIKKIIPLTSEEEEFYLSLLNELKISKKGVLLKAGEHCTFNAYIVKGCFRTYYIDKNGAEHSLSFAIEDWWVGDLYSYITGEASDLFIEALEDSEVILIKKEDYDLLFTKYPIFEKYSRVIMQRAYVSTQRRVMNNLSLTAGERYAEFCKRFPGFEQRVSQKHIASYLGITPEFLSMIRKKIAEK